jgi:hypothetical protein
VSGRFFIAVFLVLGMACLPALAQTPAENPQSDAQPLARVAAMGAQPISQPGAQGQALEATLPAVPVPPGPVPPQEIKPAPPTPIAVKKVELGSDNTWDPMWDVAIEENLPPELLSSRMAHAVHSFCPRFGSLTQADRRAYWAYFFQALSGAEAGLRPTADVRHTNPNVAVIDKVTHHTVRQQGLLQLTYEDAQRYGCDFDWENDKHLKVGDPDKSILQPENNLLCGIRILKNQLIDLDEPLLTQKSYWSTLRPGTVSYRVFAKQMANVPAACGGRAAHHKKHKAPAMGEASIARPANGAGSF